MIWRTGLVFLAAAAAVASASADPAKRQGKFFNLFNVVTFENGPCRSTDSISGDNYRNGTCLTTTECSDRGGSMEGNCAAGFGACCVFKLSEESSGTVTQNCTYIQNDGFPSALSGTNSVTYTVEKCDDDVCDLRLDFETFTTLGPADTLETTGGVCPDSFTVTSSSGITYPTVCGDLTGEHMYINMGQGETGTVSLGFTFTGAGTRQFDIKVTQVECNNESRPPDGCLQYFQGTQGRIETFNFAPTTTTTHLASQEYSACIRQEEGFSCVEYQVCSGTTNQFSLFTAAIAAPVTMALNGAACSEDFVVIEGSNTECSCGATNHVVHSRYCGVFLNTDSGSMQNVPICDCTPPFFVAVHTDNTADGTGAANVNAAVRSSGVCLEYRQIAC